MQTSNSLKDTIATSAVLFVMLATVLGATFNSESARAAAAGTSHVQVLEPIVINASRMDTVALEAIVVTASRTN